MLDRHVRLRRDSRERHGRFLPETGRIWRYLRDREVGVYLGMEGVIIVGDRLAFSYRIMGDREYCKAKRPRHGLFQWDGRW